MAGAHSFTASALRSVGLYFGSGTPRGFPLAYCIYTVRLGLDPEGLDIVHWSPTGG